MAYISQEEILSFKQRIADLEQEVSLRKQELEECRKNLNENLVRYNDLIDNSRSIILEWDTEGNILFINQWGLELFGFTQQELVGRNVVGTIVPPTDKTGYDLIGKMKAIQKSPDEFYSHENENICKNGESVWIHWTNRGILDGNGKLVKTLSVGIDRTQQHQYEIALTQYNEDLKKRTPELELANLHKSQFLANMSHELRTPLNSIIGYTKLMLDGLEGEVTPEQKEDLKTVYDNSRHLLNLINDLLDLSKIEAGKYEVLKEDIDTSEFLEKIVPGIEKLAVDKGLTLTSIIGPGAERICVDKNKTKQVLFNLLGNAVKFTRDGGVRLEIARKDGEYIFSVRDTGIGIAKKDIDSLLTSYKQVGPARLDGAEGTGLGLVICKQFVEMQGGSIRVESTEGEGCTLTFTLPEK
jgi:PAS domain S-box-containing protein